ncbi:MAG: Unknown protein [uncultured Sulfurovum sp.]|uniref:Uncharacterized protein n=1 Tax=uncultured Sulfurovum sp. TaxID=269237 RepID=A0A6S6TQG2_9BACT|nr:MAG: Unknown protein [uncultured Sulfurovum sp.]
MKFFLKLLTLTAIIFLIFGCGSSSSNEETSSNISVSSTKSTLTENNTTMNIKFLLTNTYSSKVTVEINALNLTIEPCEVQSSVFTPSEFTFDEEANIELNAELIFSDECTPTNYQLKGTTFLTLDGQTKEIELDSSLKELNATVLTEPEDIIESNTSISIDANTSLENNESNESRSDTINYAIEFSLEDEEVMKFNLEDKRSFTVALIDKDTGKYIADSQVDKIEITSKQAKLLKLFDADSNTVASDELIYEKQNNKTIYIQTYKYSGLADIDVTIEYRNIKGTVETLQKTYATIVLSGPPTAFSINSAGVSYNFETKWFENKFLISAVDKYNNIVNISPTIYVSAMTGFTRDTKGKEILYGNFGNVEGKLNVEQESKVASFEANSTLFDNIDVNRDYLYIFGKIDDYEALGKWDIDSYEGSHTPTTLALSEAFNGESHENLGFALGHNYLSDPGSSESREWQVKIDSSDGKYQLDAEGKAFVTLKFPTYFIGKRTALAVNFLGKTPETGQILRSGEVEFKTLSSFDGVHTPDSITIDKNTTERIRVYFDINTGTGDKAPVLNSHVYCDTKSSDLINVDIYQNTIVSTVEEFKLYGEYQAYWDLTLTASEDTDGTFTFEECQVRTLPRF